jgi:hypothetical protein
VKKMKRHKVEKSKGSQEPTIFKSDYLFKQGIILELKNMKKI